MLRSASEAHAALTTQLRNASLKPSQPSLAYGELRLGRRVSESRRLSRRSCERSERLAKADIRTLQFLQSREVPGLEKPQSAHSEYSKFQSVSLVRIVLMRKVMQGIGKRFVYALPSESDPTTVRKPTPPPPP